MEIEIIEDGRATILSLRGGLTIGEPENAFNREVTRLIEEGQVNLLIDLKNVGYLDSSGLGALVRALNGALGEGGTAKLVHVGEKILKLLEITQLTSVFEIYDDRDQAVASF